MNRDSSKAHLHNLTRRSLFGLAAAGLASSLQKPAQAAPSRNRLLVCIYLLGGNDGANLIVPLEDRQYQIYAALRGPLAVPSKDLLPVSASRNPGSFGFHPALSELRDLYNRGVLAVVAGVGALGRPAPGIGHAYDSLSFLPGRSFTLPFAAAIAGLSITEQGRSFTASSGVSVVPFNHGATQPGEILRAAAAARFRSPFPSTGMGAALKEVAGLAQAAGTAGLGSALITVPMGGFDTHDSQLDRQAALFQNLSASVAAFYAAAEESGIANQVTLFTDSEFGRAIRPNTLGGTDHGWANHHLVLGASVLGEDIYGAFPDMAAVSQDPSGGWAPTTSREDYHATLAAWAGVPGSANLGFMA